MTVNLVETDAGSGGAKLPTSNWTQGSDTVRLPLSGLMFSVIDTAGVMVSATDPLPVVQTGALPAGSNVIGHVVTDTGSTTAVTGTVAVTQSGVWTVAVTGVATAANQATVIASLASIDAKMPALGQALNAASVPVVLTASQLSTLTPPAAITGFATAANQTTELGHLAAIETAVEAIQAAQLPDSHNVTVDNASLAVTGTFWQATQPVSLASVPSHAVTNAGTFAVQATQSGSWTVTANAGTNLNTSALALEAGGNLAAIATDAAAIETLLTTIEANQLPDGHAVTVDNASIAVTGTFWQATQPVSGTVTANIGTVSTLATAANQTTIIGHVDGIETLLGTIDADTSNLSVVGSGTEATAIRVTIATDSTGVLSIDDNGSSITVDNAGLTELAAAINSNKVDVNIVSSDVASGGTAAADDADFTAGTTPGTPAMGVYESTPSAVTDGDLGTVGITSGRRLKTSATIDAALPAGTNNIGDVDVLSSALPTGASTSANQTTIIGHLDGVEGLLTTIDGDTGNISTKIDTIAGAVSGTEFQVDVLTMPTVTVQATDLDIRPLVNTDVVTAELSATDNAVLDAIAASVAGTLTVGSHAVTNAGTFAVQASQSGTWTVTGAGGSFPVTDSGGSLTVDAPVGTPVFVRLSDGSSAISTLPVSLASVPSHAVTNAGTFATQVDGAALTALQLLDDTVFADDAAFTLTTSKVAMAGAIRDDSLSTLTAVEGDAVPLRVSSTGALHVTGGGGGTEYTEDVATPNPIVGSAVMIERDDALSTLAPAEGDWASLRCDSVGALWTTISGTVTVGSHAVTNAGTFAVQAACTNAGTFVVQENGAALTSLQLIDDAVATTGSAITAKGLAAVGTDGTNARVLKTDSSGELQVDVLTLPALAAGTNGIGKLTANSGVTIGAVEIAAAQTLATVTTVGTVTAVTAISNALPAGTNLLGRVSSSDETSTLYNGTTALTPKYAVISASSSGNNTIVAAVTSKKIRVLAYNAIAAGAVNAKFQSGASGTDITGLKTIAAAGGGLVANYNPLGWFETASGVLLNLNLSGAVLLGGELTYVEV